MNFKVRRTISAGPFHLLTYVVFVILYKTASNPALNSSEVKQHGRYS